MQPLAITMGCPAGVGADVLLQAWQQGGLPPLFVIGDQKWLADRASQLGIDLSLTEITAPQDVASQAPALLPVMQGPSLGEVTPGTPSKLHAAAILQSIQSAVEFSQRGAASAMVTLPINKASLYEQGFTFPGHTEFLAALTGVSHDPVMMLAIEGLRVVPVTIHMALADVPAALTSDKIIHAAKITAQDLQAKFGINAPRLAIAALNPHAGEQGTLGTEEQTIIAPAVEALQSAGINAVGPLPADTLFHEQARANYDAVICMYHDQALIPLKALNFWQGVNVTLGLPIIRTSPDHGTAYDIAGTGKADAESFIAACHMAAEMAARK